MLRNIKTLGAPVLKQGVIYADETVLDVDGGVKEIEAPKAKEGDIIIITLKSDDTGTPITTILGVVSKGKITITRTDDGSSADNGVVQFVVLRPE